MYIISDCDDFEDWSMRAQDGSRDEVDDQSSVTRDQCVSSNQAAACEDAEKTITESQTCLADTTHNDQVKATENFTLKDVDLKSSLGNADANSEASDAAGPENEPVQQAAISGEGSPENNDSLLNARVWEEQNFLSMAILVIIWVISSETVGRLATWIKQ